ncbi:MAG: LOG family protein [Candidatus Sumerlaeia bacterium]|nr:LOG family protein [Candidatus Sumerlaeia bacterium]
MRHPTVTIFGSNWPEPRSEPYEDAREIGKGLAQAGITVCTGGYRGTMLAASEGARSQSGEVIGVTVSPWGPPNEFVTQSIVCDALLPRLERLVELGDAYIVLPGGTGTLLEIALVLELQFKGSMEPRPLWFLGTQWQPVLSSALAGQRHGAKWVAGQTRLPVFKFFAKPVEIIEAAVKHFC